MNSLAFALLALIGSPGVAQTQPGTLISSKEMPSLSQAELQSFMDKHLAGYNGMEPYGKLPAPSSGIRVFSVEYNSIDFKGAPAKVSGLLVYPTTGAPKGLVIYMHGTAVGNKECPSSGISDATGYAEAQVAVAAFATGGYAVAMPDYLGQGVNRDFHPYVMGSKNAPAGRDIGTLAFSVANTLNLRVEPKVFVSGYSEGGHNAMSLAQLLQDKPLPQAPLISTAGLSGPYDLSGAQRLALMAPQVKRKDELQFAIPFLTANLVHSAAHYYADLGILIDHVFKPDFALAIPMALHGNHTDMSATQFLAVAAILNGYRADSSSEFHLTSLLTPAAASAMASGDPSYPLIKVLRMYDNYDWSPNRPLYLVGLKQDTLVAFTNTESAVRAIRARGVGPDLFNHFMVDAPDQSHITNAPGQNILARRFFDSGFAGVPKL